MKQVVAFLEGYVQWIALFLGLLWMGFVGYEYWYQHPVLLPAHGQVPAYTPADFDVHVEGEFKPLMEDLESQKSSIPNDAIATKSKDPFERLHMTNLDVAVLPASFPPQPTVASLTNQESQPQTPGEKPTLPDISKILVWFGSAGGRSLVVIPPATPLPANAGPAAQPPPVGKIWVTNSFVLLQKQLAAAWQEAKLPGTFQQTEFLRVQMYRQEWVNEQWAEDTQQLIKELPVHPLLQDWPPASGEPQQKYENWAATSAADIVEPPFYTVISGPASDPWRTAMMPVTNQAVFVAVEPPYNPEHPTRPPRTPAEVQQLAEYKASLDAKAAADALARRASQAASWAKNHPGEAASATPAPTPTRRPPSTVVPPTTPHPVITPQPSPPPPGPSVPSIPPGQPIPAPAAKALPATAFTPAQIQDIEIWAHDDTVVPGHTYRYKIRLFMKNPLCGTTNVAKDQKDAEKFALEADSGWGSAVTVPPSSYFYITSVTDVGISQMVQVELFSWKDGQWNFSKVKVVPGDMIASTGWAVVDTRRDFHDVIHVLMRDVNGELVSRTAKADQSDPNYIQLMGQVHAQASAAGAPGMP